MRFYLAIAALISAGALHASDLSDLQREALQRYGANAAWESAHIEQVQRRLERVQFEAQSKSHVDALNASQRRAAEQSAQKAAQLSWWVQQSAYEKDAQGGQFERNTALAGLSLNEVTTTVQANTCEQAPLIDDGVFQSQLSASDTVWIQIDVPILGARQISTVGSEIDTRIEVYDSCPAAGDSAPVQSSDDNVGLYAEYTTKPGARLTKRQWLAIRGDSAGIVQTRVSLVGESISGQISGPSVLRAAYVRAYTKRPTYVSYVAGEFVQTPDFYYSLSFDASAAEQYLVYAIDSGGGYSPILSRLYPNAACMELAIDVPYCDLQSATALSISGGQQLADINIALDTGAKYSGRLLGLESLHHAKITASMTQPGHPYFHHTVDVDSTGRYEISGLMPNLGYALAGSARYYATTMYPNIPCQGQVVNTCNYSLTPTLKPGTYDIQLVRIPQLKINISPTSIVLGTINRYTDSATQYYFNPVDPSQIPLALGNNFVSIHVNGYQPFLFGAKRCNQPPGQERCTNFAAGTPIDGSNDREISVSLTPLPSLSGRVLGGKGEMSVRACTVSGDYCYEAVVSFDGSYRLMRMQPGNYYIKAIGSDIVDTLYPNVPCQLSQYSQCTPDLTSAQQVMVDALNVSNIDIVPEISGEISGSLIYSSGITLSGNIELAKEGLTNQIYGNISTAGAFQFRDLIPGAYRARVNSSHLFGQVFPNINCTTDCSFGLGQPITVVSNQTTPNINFAVAGKSVISGVVLSGNNAPIALLPIDIYRVENGMPIREGAVVTDAQGRYRYKTESSSGYNYIVATDSPEFNNKVYQNVVCPAGSSMYLGNCSAIGATPLALPAVFPQQFETVNFQLFRAGAFSSGFEGIAP